MIITADFRDFLASADGLTLVKQCDAQIVDPAYSARVHENAVSAHSSGEGVTQRDFGFEPRSIYIMRAIAIAAARVATWSVVFSDLESTHLWRDEMWRLGIEYVREVPWPEGAVDGLIPADVLPQRWIRWSQPQKSGDRPPTGAEATLTFHRQSGGNHPKPIRKRWNGAGSLMYWHQKSLRGEDKGATEKPLDLMLAIVSAFSAPGDAVLDGNVGWGTTALACRLLGRDCVGVEQRPEIAAHAEARETAELSVRDTTRARRWCEETRAEASEVPFPKQKFQEKTYERAQRRLADVARVEKELA